MVTVPATEGVNYAGSKLKAVALTSLILALDEVDNTSGHFASYLKEWSPRSYHDLRLKVPDVLANSIEHEAR